MPRYSSPRPPGPESLPAYAPHAPEEQDLERILAENGLPCLTGAVRRQLALYLGLLMKWNKAMNLVGARDWQTALLNLAADSFYLDKFMVALPLPPEPEIWDLGAGAGLPGIPLRLIRQAGIYRMIEAREKRALFIANALAVLKLPGTFAHQARVETFFANPPGAGQAHMILSRAFKPWREVLELSGPHLAASGLVLIMTNGGEEKAAPYGWENAGHMTYELAGNMRMFQAFKVVAS